MSVRIRVVASVMFIAALLPAVSAAQTTVSDRADRFFDDSVLVRHSGVFETRWSGGPRELCNGHTLTTFSATGVQPGTCYLRVLAADSFGIGPPTNETLLIVVGPTNCTTAPSVPTNLVSWQLAKELARPHAALESAASADTHDCDPQCERSDAS